MSLLKGFPLETIAGCKMVLFTTCPRVLLRCGKGVTNQQWSIVGVVNDFLDSQQVQYSLLPQRVIVIVKSTLLVQYQYNISTVLMLLFFICFDWLIPAIQPCVQAEIY